MCSFRRRFSVSRPPRPAPTLTALSGALVRNCSLVGERRSSNPVARLQGIPAPLIWCGLPRVLLLPPCHDLPVGQVWDPAIGLDGFLASLLSMSAGVASLQSGWKDSPLLREWFARAASRPDDLCIHLTPRALLAHSLVVTGDAAPPIPVDRELAYLDRQLAFRLHRDYALSVATARLRTWYLQYEAKAFAQTFPSDSYLGRSPPALCADLWFVRPPAIKAWQEHPPFRLRAFVDPALQPLYMREYLRIHVSWNKDPPLQPLETRAEAQERLLMDEEASPTQTPRGSGPSFWLHTTTNNQS